MEQNKTADLPPDDDRTIIINRAGNGDATIRLDNAINAAAAATAVSGNTTSLLRNVDEEIKLSVTAAGNDLSLFTDSGEEGIRCDAGNLYVNGQQLGRGGQGIVFSASDIALHREVAVKSLRPELLGVQEARTGFINEARLTAALDHPAIIPIYSLCCDGNSGLHLAMKQLRGISLKEHLNMIIERYAGGGIANFDEEASLAYRLNIFGRVCEAMEYVHSKNVIHCDLKPENIMIGEFNETYVLDWGIARPVNGGDGQNGSSKIMGTPRYTSPENLRGEKCGIHSDIYSLGVILFELVTLTPAFSGENAAEVISRVKTGNFNELRHRYGYPVSRDLIAIIRKATAAAPEDRYASALALRNDIFAFLRGAEVSANPDSRLKKLYRWAKRNRRKALFALSGSIAAVFALAVFIFFAASIRLSEDRRLRENIIDLRVARAAQTAISIDRKLNHIASTLGILNSDVAMLLDLNRHAGAVGELNIFSGSGFSAGAKAENIFFPGSDASSHYPPEQPIDLANATRHNAPGADMKKIEHTRKCLPPIVSRLRRTVLRSDPDTAHLSDTELLVLFRQLKLPVSYSFVSLDNGLHIVFPGNDRVPGDYDGRKRPWYRHARGHGDRPVWTLPYTTTFQQNELVVSCSMEIVGTGKVHGVSGVDVPLAVFKKDLNSNPDADNFTISRQLLDRNGEVFLKLDCRSGQFSYCGDTGKFDQQMFSRMRANRFGNIVKNTPGGDVMYIYSIIPSSQWFYVEEISLNMLISSANAAKADRNIE